MAEKTHDPTPKRLREAREKGDVPQAPLVAGAIGLFVVLATARGVVHQLAANIATATAAPQEIASIDAWSVVGTLLSMVAPLALGLAFVAIAAGIVQGSVTFSMQRLAPDPSRLEPFSGLKKLFDPSRLWGAARGLVVLCIGGVLVGRIVLECAVEAARSTGGGGFATLAVRAASRALVTVGAFACGVAVLDAIVARTLWLGRHRMSRDEVVREHKEGEGDPDIKRRREELHHELLAGEALGAVRDATVLVVNPTHLACALRYDDGASDDAAPTLLAKGQGALAARMIEHARHHGVPIVRDVPVARALYDLEIGTEIPEALYEAVAEVLRAAWEDDDG